MGTRTGSPLWHRSLAAVVLASLAVAFVAPALSAGGGELHKCMPPAAAASGPVLHDGPHGTCGHMDLGTCEAALACTSLPSVALAAQVVRLAGLAPLSRAVVTRGAAVADLFHVGPPTPPPNS